MSASPSPSSLDQGRQSLEKANALIGQQRWKEGIVLYGQAATHLPEWHLPHFNSGVVLVGQGRDDDARQAFERSVARKPDCWESHFNLALLHLRNGRFVEGWKEYDWRFRAAGMPAIRVGRPQPLWDGRELQQGLGDLIQFLRFVPAVLARGARVLLECPSSLRRLVETFPGIDGVVDPQLPCEEADYQIPLLSVPRILGDTFDTLPIDIPYLKTRDEERPDLDALLGDDSAIKIGVAWAGDPGNPLDTVRSCGPKHFRPLAALPGVRLFSLQYRDGDLSADDLAASGISSLGAALGDFAETAAIAQRLDLILTVDTVTAHLAGALGCPTWALLSQPCDWRWPSEGTTTPWYPNLRLFRQGNPGDWGSVFSAVKGALAEGDH